MLSIRLLGAPYIAYADHPVAISRRKSRALLYYLAAHAMPLTRDHLLTFFWPDADRQAAQQNLRSTLYGLRKIFGDLLIANEDTLALDVTTTVDTRLFTAQLALPNSDLTELQATLDLYQGDFLNGFTLPDLPEFDDWATLQRAHYRRLMVTGLARLSGLYEAQQAYRHALTVLDRALAFEPLQEDVQRDALRLQTLAGDRAGAIRRYESFRQLLIDELGMPPMAETQALYDAIITDTFPLAPRASSFTPPSQPMVVAPRLPQSLPFVGRDTELQTLGALAMSNQLILLEGEAGIGKSRLLEEFIQRQQPNSTASLVLIGQARELEASLPYQPLIEALRVLFTHPDWPTLNQNLNLSTLWRAEVARLLPELTPPGDDQALTLVVVDELRLWEGIAQFLLALARQRPVRLILDDVHWADSSTLGLLGYLLRKASQNQAAIYFIAACHTVVSSTPLALLLEVLLREDRLMRLPLARLPPAAIARLAEQISPTTTGLAAWLTSRSEGNPFILEELIQYARDAQLLGADNLTGLIDTPAAQGVPETVYALIRTRLARLSEASRQVLNTAAVIGREFEVEVVARSVTLSDADVLDNLDELQRLGLIQPTGMRYRFDHYLTVQVAYQEMGEPRRRLCHRRVAEALESLYRHRLEPLAGLLAHHFAKGKIDERAAHYALQAGQRAASLAAWREAIGFYEQALVLAEPLLDQSQRQAVLFALGRACLHAGQYPRASDALRLALSLTSLCERPVDEGLLYASLMEALLFETRYAELIVVAEQSSVNGEPETASNAEFYRGVALAQIGVNLAEAIVHLQKAEHLLSQPVASPEITNHSAASSTTLGNVKLELGNIFARLGDLSTAIAYFRAGIEVTRAMDSDRTLRLHILFHNNLAYHLQLQQDPTAAEVAQFGLTLAQEKGILAALPYLYSTLGEIALAQQDLSAAEDYFNQGLVLAHQFSALERIAGLTANLGLVAQQRGDQALAVQCLTDALAQAEALNIRFLVTQVRLWLAALLPPTLARDQLAHARLMAEQDGYRQLLAKVIQLEKENGEYE
ncbi:AAA family ATPase [soil metagenome]